MAKKRSKKVQEVVDALNELLKLDNVYITLEDQSVTYVSTTNPKAQLFKQGICEALERVLHRTNSYAGYMFLANNLADTSRKFDRKYF